ncbi:nucleoside triphosphate pyrophosphohydrolase [Haloarchaeobius sp. HRN-SO-5]|uniref:nucleoside triphosphate pyrophosphohydrolase n=1 Tax=Haloarchaeobius sp. HRN-SO-5 TaxID=3446118 RepID=UPI003EBA7083
MERYGKLVRDRIPAVVRENGETPVFHAVEGEDYRRRLREKLVEEATEFRDDPSTEELADVVEVVEAIRAAEEVEDAALESKRRAKRDARGGFEEGIVLDRVE